MANQERRRAARINDSELSLKLRVGQADAVTNTLNISSSGLYCKVDRELPLMSRVQLALMIPISSAGTKETKEVMVEGVVVRAHPVIVDGKTQHYDVAIFFDNLDPKTKEMITAYISRKKAA